MVSTRAELQGAPTTLGTKWHVAGRLRTVGVISEPIGKRGGSAALVGGCGGKGTKPGPKRFGTGSPFDILQGELVGGNGSRLVETDDIDVIHRFDRVDVLHNGTPLREADGADGKRDGHAE